MDDKKFKDKLTEVAEWVIPTVGQNGGPAKPNLRKKTLEVVINEFGEEEEIEIEESDENLTLSPKIKKIFPITQPCPDCGRVCTDRTVTYRFCHPVKGRPYWKIKCTECRNHKNPWTGEFNVLPDQVGRVYQEYSTEDGTKIPKPDSIFAVLKSRSTK